MLLAFGAPILPVLVLAAGSRYVWTRKAIHYSLKFWGLLLTFIATLAIYHHFKIPVGREVLPESLMPGGGLIGGMVLFCLAQAFRRFRQSHRADRRGVVLALAGDRLVAWRHAACSQGKSRAKVWPVPARLWPARWKTPGARTMRRSDEAFTIRNGTSRLFC